MAKQHSDEQNSSPKFIAVVLLLAAGLIFLYAQKQSNESKKESESLAPVRRTAESEALVNKYLQETNARIEALKLHSAIVNNFKSPSVGQLVPKKPEASSSWGVDAPEDSSQKQFREALVPGAGDDDSSPRAIIEGQLAEKQQRENYERQYKEKYIQEFIENAKKNGWSIKVDKNGVVTQSSPIPNFEQSNHGQSRVNIFNPSATGP